MTDDPRPISGVDAMDERQRGWYWLKILQQDYLEWVEVEFANFWTGERWLHPCVETEVLGPIPTRSEIEAANTAKSVIVPREVLELVRAELSTEGRSQGISECHHDWPAVRASQDRIDEIHAKIDALLGGAS